MNKILRWTLCLVGIHWRGKRGLGMYGDAAKCNICGADGYRLLVIKQEK